MKYGFIGVFKILVCMSKKQYLYIEPFVYLSLTNDSLLLFNTLTNKSEVFEELSIVNFFAKAISNNLYINDIEWDIYQNRKDWIDFISWLRNSFSGDLLSIEETPPIISKPNLDEFNIEYIELSKIINLEIYLASDCKHHCCGCGKYNYQFLFCKKNSFLKCVDEKSIFVYIEKISIDRISSISLVGGNIWEYVTGLDFINKLALLDCEITFYVNIRNLIGMDLSLMHISTCKLNILIDESLEFDIVKSFDLEIKKTGIDYTYSIVVKELSNIIENELFNKSIFLPFYDGNDLFFYDYVFLNKSNILNSDLSMREIYNKTHVNTCFMGKLIIDYDGSLYTSFNRKKIGNINQDDMHLIFNKLFDKKALWRLSRKDVPICKDCLYKYICPSISNYELVMNRFDLCNVHSCNKKSVQ